MVYFACLFHLLLVIVFDNDALVFKLGVVAADSACLSAEEQLDLRLVLALDLLLGSVVDAILTHVSEV